MLQWQRSLTLQEELSSVEMRRHKHRPKQSSKDLRDNSMLEFVKLQKGKGNGNLIYLVKDLLILCFIK